MKYLENIGIQYVVGLIFYILFNLFFSSANKTHTQKNLVFTAKI